MGQLGRFFSIVEKLVEGNFEGAGQLFQRLDRRHGVAVLHTRYVGASKTAPFFDIALGELLCSTKATQTICDEH